MATSQLRTRLQDAYKKTAGRELPIRDVMPTPLEGIYQVELTSGELLYGDGQGRFLFLADMYEITPEGLRDYGEDRRAQRVREQLSQVDESEMIIFRPPGEAVHTISVFTDVDCGYCRRLHEDLDAMFDLGIEVRYLAFPRSGEDSGSFDKMVAVWCSPDRHRALTQAKRGQNLPPLDCEAPVLEQFELGVRLGVSGTPAVFAADGRVLRGYGGLDMMRAFLDID